MKKIAPERLTHLLRSTMRTRDNDAGCEACFEMLDRYVDMHLAGEDAARAIPMVETHLENCADCREEFEMLVEILKHYPQ